MKITYTAPNRSHHYPYAEALNRAGHLHAFVTGFSRFSSRAPLPSLGSKLKRHDFLKHLHLGSLKLKAPYVVESNIDRLSSSCLDRASYKYAKESDVFIYYRTNGLNTTSRIHREKGTTICVMEEVNSHVEVMNDLLRKEYEQIGLGKYSVKISDYELRLKAYQEADCILCPSEFVRQSFLSKGFPAEKIIKVNFGFPPLDSAGIERRNYDSDVFRLLYVGQLHYRKGLRYAIEAFRQLRHRRKEFIIVGPKTPETGLERTQIPDGVIFTGPLKGEALLEQYRNASIFILPSIEEGLALVQGEALTFGVPLLITSNTGGADIIRDGVEGFIVPPFNTDLMSARLQEMADDQALLKSMSQAALEAARSLGSWDKAVERLIINLSKFAKDKMVEMDGNPN